MAKRGEAAAADLDAAPGGGMAAPEVAWSERAKEMRCRNGKRQWPGA